MRAALSLRWIHMSESMFSLFATKVYVARIIGGHYAPIK